MKPIFSFIHAESKTIIGAATIVGFFSFFSRLVGFIRDRVLAGMFGAGDTLDVYYAAFKIPDFLFSLIVIGAVSASFIPIFTKQFEAGEQKDAWDFVNITLHLLGGGMILFSILLFLFANPLSALIAPGFDSEKQQRVAEFMRIMLGAQVLLTCSMVLGSVLQGLKRFFLYALAPIFYNVGIMLGVWLLSPWMGSIGLAWGVVLGAFLHLGCQLIGCFHAGYTYRFYWTLKDSRVAELFRLTGPRILGIAMNQLLFLVLMIIATLMAAGSVTIFQFAYNIQFFPVGIFGVSFAIAVFPIFTEAINKNDLDFFRSSFISTIRQTIFFLIPLTLLFLVLRSQIVRVVVGAGAFDWEATVRTADTLAFFALTFIPQAFVFILARAFFALHDTVTPLTAALVSGLVGVLSAFLFGRMFGVMGLAMAYSLSVVVNAILLWIPLRKRVQTLLESSLVSVLMKLSIAGIACGLVAQFSKPLLLSFLSLDTFFGVFLQGLIAGGLGLVSYVLVAWLLSVEEVRLLIHTLKRRGLSRHIPTESVDVRE